MIIFVSRSNKLPSKVIRTRASPLHSSRLVNAVSLVNKWPSVLKNVIPCKRSVSERSWRWITNFLLSFLFPLANWPADDGETRITQSDPSCARWKYEFTPWSDGPRKSHLGTGSFVRLVVVCLDTVRVPERHQWPIDQNDRTATEGNLETPTEGTTAYADHLQVRIEKNAVPSSFTSFSI